MPGVRCPAGQCTDGTGREARIDPVCHTLVGAALARSGLRRRTALGASALVIGANLPDLDALAYFAGPAADLEWRRGWSHGVLALAVLPLLLTGSLLLYHRLSRSRRHWHAPMAMAPRQLLLLSFIAILSHPLLDTLNTYGVRWLMPFSGTWFYGDTLFIIDPWVWLVLSVSLYISARRQKAQRADSVWPVWLALGLLGLYVGAMAFSSAAVERIVRRDLAGPASAVRDVMAGPVPLNPLLREFVIEQDGQYQVGTFRWGASPHVEPDDIEIFPRGQPRHPAVELAANSTLGRRFLGWARYPTFDLEQVGRDQFLVHVIDLRYARRPGERFGTVSIPVTVPTASLPYPDTLSTSRPAAPASRDP